jgi:hypothetical protein
MGTIPLTTKIIILILVCSYLAVIGLAFYKIIKSRLPDWEKVYWAIAVAILQLIAAIPFIIYHDYFLSPTKKQ